MPDFLETLIMQALWSLVSGLFGGPSRLWIIGIVAAAVLGAFGVQAYRIHSLKADLVTAGNALTLEQAAHATCEAQKQTLRANIDAQNVQVNGIAKDCKARSADADAAALRALHQSHPAPSGAGAKDLNQWFAQRFPH